MPYLNGEVPYSVVSVVLASGHDENGYWEFRCTPAFAARWAFAKAEAVRRFGRPIFIRTGWNIYRPLFSQVIARDNACAAGNCAGAAVPKTSSHGGEWRGRPCLAVDVDPNGLTWDQVDEAMEAAGFAARLITEAMSGIRGGERWHYIDFNAFGPVPAGMDATPFEEDEMNRDQDAALAAIYANQGRLMQVIEALDVRTGNTQTGNLAIAAERIAALPENVWAHPLAHSLTGQPVAAGDFLRYEPAEHENTRRAVAAIGTAVVPDFDYEQVAAEIAEKFPKLDPHAFAVAAADEADRRERERLG